MNEKIGPAEQSETSRCRTSPYNDGSCAHGDFRHGVSAGYMYHGCRCPECREYGRRQMEMYRRRHGIPKRVTPEGNARCYTGGTEVCEHENIKHGTYSTYKNHGCRCGKCREAYLTYVDQAQKRRRERLRRGEVEIKHGTYGAYTTWGCRCVDCRRANSDYSRSRLMRARTRRKT